MSVMPFWMFRLGIFIRNLFTFPWARSMRGLYPNQLRNRAQSLVELLYEGVKENFTEHQRMFYEAEIRDHIKCPADTVSEKLWPAILGDFTLLVSQERKAACQGLCDCALAAMDQADKLEHAKIAEIMSYALNEHVYTIERLATEKVRWITGSEVKFSHIQ